jgi:Secretion system C-terminal sorting domain
MKKIISIILVSLFTTGLLFCNTSSLQNSIAKDGSVNIVRYEPGSVYSPVNREDTVVFIEDFSTGLPSNWLANDLTNPGSYWYTSLFNPFGGEGLSWRMADEQVSVNGGYLDGWYQVLDTPVIALPSSGNMILSFEQFRAIEAVGTHLSFDGWDGFNVRIRLEDQDYVEAIVLTDCSPAYNCNSLFGFGSIHHEDEDGEPGIPGWGGSTDWTSTEIDIPDSYHGQNVIISFAFASDDYTSTSTNPEFTGIFLDEIDIAGVFFNDGEDTTGWEGFTNTPIGGNLWHVYEDNETSSPPNALGCFDIETGTYNPDMENYITTSTISLPADADIYIDMDLQTAFDDSLFPDCDYFSVEVSYLITYFGNPYWSDWNSISNPTGDPNLENLVFTGTTGDWTTFSQGWNGFNDISDLNGELCRFRIGLHSNSNYNVASGIRIDDFRIISSTNAGLPPQDLTVLLNQDFSVFLIWSSLPNALSYNIYRGSNPADLSLITSSISTASYIDYSPISGQNNYYALTANLSSGETGLSDLVQVYVPSDTADILAYDDGFSNFGFNVGSLNSMAVLFEPDYTRTDQTVTHIQFYIEALNSGPVAICAWYEVDGIPQNILSGFPISIPNSQIVSGWNTIELPLDVRPQFSTGNFFFGINEFSNLPSIGFDEDSIGNSFSNVNGWEALSNGNIMIRVIVDSDPTGAENPIQTNQNISMSNYPNPFNPTTIIQLNLQTSEQVRLDIYNLKGQHIKTLLDETVPAGTKQVEWNGTDTMNKPVSSGMYFYKVKTNKQNKINKMLLLK